MHNTYHIKGIIVLKYSTLQWKWIEWMSTWVNNSPFLCLLMYVCCAVNDKVKVKPSLTCFPPGWYTSIMPHCSAEACRRRAQGVLEGRFKPCHSPFLWHCITSHCASAGSTTSLRTSHCVGSPKLFHASAGRGWGRWMSRRLLLFSLCLL